MKRAGFSCAVLTAAALMTLGSAATAFAGEWVAEGTEWRYLENNGTYATDSWRPITASATISEAMDICSAIL